MTNKFVLDSLIITKAYGESGGYSCQISIKGDNTDTKLKLTNEQGAEIVNLVADQLVESARSITSLLTRESMGLPLLTVDTPEGDEDAGRLDSPVSPEE